MALVSIIKSVGSYLPKKVMKNQEFEKFLNTSDDWIVERTGIKQRHIAARGELTSNMAHYACIEAIKNIDFDINLIDLIIVATTTSDNSFPATATKLQALLGVKRGAAFDIQAVCGGFVYALTVADSLIKARQANNILVVGVDMMSKLLDWNDRSSCILFGDGAGAVILSSNEQDEISGGMIIDNELHSDGALSHLLYSDGGISLNQQVGKLRMIGREVYKHAVEKMAKSIIDILTKNNLSLNDADVIIPHQANIRILEGIAKRLDISLDKFVITVPEHANTSAASIPLALSVAINNKQIKSGDNVVLCAIGGGLTWGASLIKWY